MGITKKSETLRKYKKIIRGFFTSKLSNIKELASSFFIILPTESNKEEQDKKADMESNLVGFKNTRRRQRRNVTQSHNRNKSSDSKVIFHLYSLFDIFIFLFEVHVFLFR